MAPVRAERQPCRHRRAQGQPVPAPCLEVPCKALTGPTPSRGDLGPLLHLHALLRGTQDCAMLCYRGTPKSRHAVPRYSANASA